LALASSSVILYAGVRKVPGAMLITLIPTGARSRAAVMVRPMTPPLAIAYAVWPTWPSKPAMLAVVMTTPR